MHHSTQGLYSVVNKKKESPFLKGAKVVQYEQKRK